MGNSPSVELQRRAPQKLSKPRVGNPSTAGLLTPNGYVNTSSSHRMSLAGLVRPLSYPLVPAPSPTATTADLHGTVAQQDQAKEKDHEHEKEHDDNDDHPDLDVDKPVPVVSVQPLPEETEAPSRRNSIFRSRSSRRRPKPRDHPSRRHSSIGPPRSSTPGDRQARANSMTFESSFAAYYGDQVPEK